MNATPNRRVFVSYSHKDQEWLERFLTMLTPYVEKDGLSIWSDRDISSGSAG